MVPDESDTTHEHATTLPCPFCGDVRVPDLDHETIVPGVTAEDVDNGPVHFATCLCCGARGPLAINAEQAARIWNNRVVKP